MRLDSSKEPEVCNIALAQLPLKTKAGQALACLSPGGASPAASIPCRCRWVQGWDGRGPSAPRVLPRQSGAPRARSRGQSRCRGDRGSACSQPALAEGRAGHGGCAAVCAGGAGGALFCRTEVAHLAPSTAGLNFVPAQVPLSSFPGTCTASVQMFATSMALGFQLIKLCIPVGSL